jgi:hypothetical protein
VNYGAILRNFGPEYQNGVLEQLLRLREKYPLCPKVNRWYRNVLEKSGQFGRMVGDAGLSDDVTTIGEGPFDLPPVPLNGSTVIERVCRIQKIANQGTAAGGLHAILYNTDMAPYSDGVYRIKEVKSWTIPKYNSGASAAEYSAVSVPAQQDAGTEIMPAWETNWTRVGSGFSGMVTKFPLGDLPLYPGSGGSALELLTHFVGDGFTSGSATDFLSVVFDVVLECLI